MRGAEIVDHLHLLPLQFWLDIRFDICGYFKGLDKTNISVKNLQFLSSLETSLVNSNKD